MTDLEIMLMLEEEGYEPSIENVQIFKEEYLDESTSAQRKRDKKYSSLFGYSPTYNSARIRGLAAEERLETHKEGRRAAKLMAKYREAYANGKPDVSKSGGKEIVSLLDVNTAIGAGKQHKLDSNQYADEIGERTKLDKNDGNILLMLVNTMVRNLINLLMLV